MDARLADRTRPIDQKLQTKPRRSPSPSSSLHIELTLGWDRSNRQSVALKTFRTDPPLFRGHPGCRLVEYETKAMDRVASHPNIVRLLQVVIRSRSIVCLVMEAAAVSRQDLVETIAAAPGGR